MSKISLKHSGGNVVSLNSPTSAPTSADVAFKLPNADGTNGQRIITDGSGNLSFASSGASGKLLQVVTTPDADRTTQGSVNLSSQGGTADLTHFALTITPSSATSKIRISVHIGGEFSSHDYSVFMKIKRSISGGATTNIQGATVGSKTEVITSMNSSGSDSATTLNNIQFSGLIDSPNTTSAITYTPVMINVSGSNRTYYYNRTVNNEDAYNRQHSVSWVTLEEIAA